MTNRREQRISELLPLDNRPGPYRLGPHKAENIVQSALREWRTGMGKPVGVRTGRLLLLAAAAFTLTSAAAALIIVDRFGQPTRPPQQSFPAPSTSPAVMMEKTPRDALLPDLQSLSPVRPVTDNPPDRVLPARTSRRTATRPVVEDPLRRANLLRQQGKWRDAERTYRSVCVTYPKTTSAYVALVAAAAIRLDHLNDPDDAAALYRQAIASHPSGVLDVEARLGIARSWRQLGQPQREIEALRALLRRHPSGPLAEQAQRRLEAIADVN
jgi:tetratricopeptide (TPR) repeat protein